MANTPGPVLVIGATGQQGGATARALLECGWTVHALVRDAGKPAARSLREAGARLVTGDLDDPASLLRPVFFMDNFATLHRPVLVDGQLVVSLALRPETRLRMIATGDIGAFAAIAFDRPERFLGRHIDIAGDALTGQAIAESFGRACGVPARFHEMPIERVRAFDEEVARMFEWLNEPVIDGLDFSTLRAQHPGLMTLETWLRATGWKPVAPGEGESERS